MTQTDAHFSISLDGFMAGPDQDRDSPLGVRGLELHRWHFADDMTAADTAQVEDLLRPRGAFVMGRNMYGPIRGEWDEEWRG
ncbi:MAG TPA: dihydrofolate reductase, partial [Solirubrobacteraceae bacterium]